MTTRIKTKTLNIGNDQEIIDVPGNKLLEWLTDRKKIQQHWKRSQSNILKLIDNACEVSSIEKKEYSYYDCQRIFKEFESAPGGNATTLFGAYSNVNTQKWFEVIKAYEKDNYHIGESCQILSHNLNYEIPNLRKTIEKSIKTIEEDQKKPYLKNKTTALSTFKKACNDLGIKGDRIREEIIELPLQLTPLFNEVVDSLSSNKSVSNSIEFYNNFLRLTKVELDDTCKEPLPLLLFLIKHGNVTMKEREIILNPQKIKLNDQIKDNYNNIKDDDNNNNKNNENNDNNGNNNINSENQPNLEIDWCITEDVVPIGEQPVIVWEDSEVDLDSQNIEWDDFSMDTIEMVDGSSITTTIELVESGGGGEVGNDNSKSDNNNNFKSKPNIEIEEKDKQQEQEQEQKQQDRFDEPINPNETILEFRPLRNQFLDELFELEIFLNNRCFEMEKSNSMFGIDQLNDESTDISTSQCKEYLKSISDILIKLSNTRVRQILEIKSSKKFVDRLVLQFTQKQQNIAKYTQLIIESDQKIEDLNLTLGQSRNKIDQFNKETKILKSNLEQSISNSLFDKKKINIMIPFSLN
ncbi:hypothetical protein ACTFIW_002391 [Dictyostelium discoideum]